MEKAEVIVFAFLDKVVVRGLVNGKREIGRKVLNLTFLKRVTSFFYRKGFCSTTLYRLHGILSFSIESEGRWPKA